MWSLSWRVGWDWDRDGCGTECGSDDLGLKTSWMQEKKVEGGMEARKQKIAEVETKENRCITLSAFCISSLPHTQQCVSGFSPFLSLSF